jgi:hypothetical protein
MSGVVVDEVGLGETGSGGAGWCHFDAGWYFVAYPEVQGELEQTDFLTVRRLIF